MVGCRTLIAGNCRRPLLCLRVTGLLFMIVAVTVVLVSSGMVTIRIFMLMILCSRLSRLIRRKWRLLALLLVVVKRCVIPAAMVSVGRLRLGRPSWRYCRRLRLKLTWVVRFRKRPTVLVRSCRLIACSRIKILLSVCPLALISSM